MKASFTYVHTNGGLNRDLLYPYRARVSICHNFELQSIYSNIMYTIQCVIFCAEVNLSVHEHKSSGKNKWNCIHRQRE